MTTVIEEALGVAEAAEAAQVAEKERIAGIVRSRDTFIKAVKKALQTRSGKTWSVTGGRGTAYGWVTISVPPKRLGCARFHDADRDRICAACGGSALYGVGSIFCEKHVCTDKCYTGYIQPEDRAELAALLGFSVIHAQGVNVASRIIAYREFLARAEGREVEEMFVPDWD